MEILHGTHSGCSWYRACCVVVFQGACTCEQTMSAPFSSASLFLPSQKRRACVPIMEKCMAYNALFFYSLSFGSNIQSESHEHVL